MNNSAYTPQCGGMGLPMLAKLQEKGIGSYDKAVEELKSMNEELYFYTPRYTVTVRGNLIIIS